LKRADDDAVSIFRWSLVGTGRTHLLGEPGYATVEEAARAWDRVRREVWAREHVGHIPRAAECFDGLTCLTREAACEAWETMPYPHGLVLEAVAADRAAVEKFRQTDPAGAHAVADYLGAWLPYLDVRERASEAMARRSAPFGPHPYHERYGKYGELQRGADGARLLSGTADDHEG
jgi:hypothetical protein